MAQPQHTVILGDISEIIEHIKNHTPEGRTIEQYVPEDDAFEYRRRYRLIREDKRPENYYRNVAICKMLYSDLVHGTNLTRLEKYAPGISSVDPEDVVRIRYLPEDEDFVIRTTHDTFRIYKGDVQYIYPLYCHVRDNTEFELAYEDDRVITFHIFDDTGAIDVFEV
ncbi:hypothetical protein EF808_05930 [archaeon]|nr:MAG: hypothetical protein EF808_05930 [archaeon]